MMPSTPSSVRAVWGAPFVAEPARIIYDGECPFCASYVGFARLRKRLGAVELINAREHPDLVESLAARGYAIDDGMVVEMDGKVYFGSEAMWAINTLLSANPLLRLVSGRLFLKLTYPFMRGGRNLTLRVLGRRPIAAPRS